MLKSVLCLGMGLLLHFAAVAQNQIPDGDFESWSSDQLNLYEYPASGWWSSLNPLRTLGGPVSVNKDGDAHSGNYSAHLETFEYGTLLVPGMLLSGTFNLLAAPNYFTRGRPYTERPAVFRGWYKYSPVQGDSAAIAVQVTRWNSTTQQRDTVGEVGIIIRQAASGWTEFVLPIDYYSQETPDTLVVVATSSAAADQLIGQVGSELWIDDFDLELVHTSSPASIEQPKVKLITGSTWQIEVEEDPVNVEIISSNGALLHTYDLRPGTHQLSNDQLSQGIYIIKITGPKNRSLIRKALLNR